MTVKKETTSHLLKSIDNQLQKQNSLKLNFKAGVMRGLGAALGATIVAALIFAVIALIFETADKIPLIRDFIDSDSLKDTLNN